jgi:hypothetical protein
MTTRTPAWRRPRDHHPDASGATGDERALSTQIEKFCMRCELAVYHLPPFSLVVRDDASTRRVFGSAK